MSVFSELYPTVEAENNYLSSGRPPELGILHWPAVKIFRPGRFLVNDMKHDYVEIEKARERGEDYHGHMTRKILDFIPLPESGKDEPVVVLSKEASHINSHLWNEPGLKLPVSEVQWEFRYHQLYAEGQEPS
jgi:hypothetical protein